MTDQQQQSPSEADVRASFLLDLARLKMRGPQTRADLLLLWTLKTMEYGDYSAPVADMLLEVDELKKQNAALRQELDALKQTVTKLEAFYDAKMHWDSVK
jgi:cell division protein FtsB